MRSRVWSLLTIGLLGAACAQVEAAQQIAFEPAWLKPPAKEPYCPPGQQTRFHEYTKKFFAPAGPAGVEAATYLGGPGSEWLAGGGFQPDGCIVVAGTCLGPELIIAGHAPTTVLGTDVPAPAQTSAPGWNNTQGAPFVVRLSTDLSRIVGLVRLPWGTGSVTDCLVDAQGAIHLAGCAGPRLDALGEVVDVSDPEDQPDPKHLPAWVARLDPTAARVAWVRRFADGGRGARLRLSPKGELVVEGGWTYVFDATGKRLQVARTHKTSKWRRGVSPVDFSTALGWDTNTSTGREPWRQPHLVMKSPDGKDTEYYVWDPKLVGSDKYRLVSDSTFRHFYFADDGTLWAVGWSDGGNTVFERMPKDLDKPVSGSGLGFSAWGAGVLSLCHIMHIDTKAGVTLSKTLWCGFLRGKQSPSSATIDQLSVASDGSLVMAGGSAAGLIQTGNHLHAGATGGPYVAVLDRDLSSIRFSSTLAATGEVRIKEEESWNSATALFGKRHKVLVVCGAVEKKATYEPERPAPTWRAIQERFGGGATDGWLLLLDLGPAKK